jgi:hypothetical protein
VGFGITLAVWARGTLDTAGRMWSFGLDWVLFLRFW